MNVDTAVHPVLVLVVFIAQMVSMNTMVMMIDVSFVVLAAMAEDVCTARPASIGMALEVSVDGVVRIIMATDAFIARVENTTTND